MERLTHSPTRRWLNGVWVAKGTTVLVNSSYATDAVGNITSITGYAPTPSTPSGMGGPPRFCYYYDSLDRLVAATGDYSASDGRYGRYDEGLFTSTRQRADIAWRYMERVEPIESLPVGIPSNIALVRDATLSQSVRQWMAIEQPEPFSRIGVARDLKLIAIAEAHVSSERLVDIDTKLTVLALATMPFDERERRLMDAWRTMVDAQLTGGACELPLPQTELDASSLAQLEADYRYCDLLYTYERLFAGTAERISQLVTCRNGIAHAIMTMLDASHER